MKVKIAVLVNEDSQSHVLWESALKKSKEIEFYDIIDLTSDNWLEMINKKQYDLFLLKPPGKTDLFKRLYDERVLLINQYKSTPIFPSLNEILIYENKKFLRDWLMIRNLPHPETHVFFNKTEADDFLKRNISFPIVGKTNIGASGNGVQIIKTREQAEEYLIKAFASGITPKTGPKLTKGSLTKKIYKAFKVKGFLKQRLKDYKSNQLNIQYHFVILQEFIKHEWEWRCVRIGDSFFAHKKIVKGDMASGTLIKGYDPVPIKLLDFIKNISDDNKLSSVAIDVFERNNQFFINEIQCFFGQSDPYQMLVDGKPGKYMFVDNKWVFEEGMFNTNESYDLRLEHALKQICI
jgi:glutathione synthase/RimK-type ligase-like ATP-grasp enzyme